jgi:O-antigen/teichoic acid export membrane protein
MKHYIRDKVKFLKSDLDLFELIKGSFSSFGGKVLGMLFGYLAALFISNIYGANTLGFYSLSITVLGVITLIPKFGFDSSLIRILNETLIKGNKKNFISVIKRTSVFSFILSIIATLILYVYAEEIAIKILKSPEIKDGLKASSFAIIPTVMLVIVSVVFQAYKSTFMNMLFKTTLINFVFFVALVVSYFNPESSQNIMILYSISCLIAFIISCYFLKLKLGKYQFNLTKEFSFSTKDILNISYPMMFSNSFAVLLGWINTLILGYYFSETYVGIYDSTERLSALSNISLMAINAIAAPKFAEAFSKKDYLNLENVTKKSTKMIFFTTIPFLFLFIFFGEFLLSLFGEEFKVGYWALFYLCLGRFCSATAGSVGYLLQMTGKQKIFQNVIFLAFLINLVLCLLFIPSYGYVGAAIAKCIAVIFWNITLVIIIKRKFGFWTVYVPFLSK